MTAPAVSPARLVDPELHATGDPHSLWRWMREHAPIYRHEPTELPAFWSLTRYVDIRTVYLDPRTFSSANGVLLRPTRHGDDPGGGQTLALTDPPRHKQLRSLIADWFTARAARLLESSIRATVRTALRRAIERGECDFVHDVAARISPHVICTLMGVPEDDFESVFDWTNEAFEAEMPLATHQRFMGYFIELMYQRMLRPTDDLMSALANGTVDGEQLSEPEILLNCENLVGATENARLSMAGGMLAFLEHPDQWRRLRENPGLLPTAVEEVLRWTSSATHSMRTATATSVIRGRTIAAGDRVVLWIPSANRDSDAFDAPNRFDIARRPNRHLALGSGEHLCVGSGMARTQTRVLLSELLAMAGGVERCGPVVPVRSLAVSGPEVLPVRITAR